MTFLLAVLLILWAAVALYCFCALLDVPHAPYRVYFLVALWPLWCLPVMGEHVRGYAFYTLASPDFTPCADPSEQSER